MSQRVQYLIQVIEKIASPLLEAVTAVQVRNPAVPPSIEADAQRIAELLGRSMQVSIDLGRLVEIDKLGIENSDSLRVALAALAGPIVASQYQALSRPPAEAETKRLVGALEAVMAFADNFSSSPESLERLKAVKAGGAPADAHQMMVQYLQAFVPVVDAVSAFSFGQPEKKMAQDIAGQIIKKAREILDQALPGVSPDMRPACELALTRSLAGFYAQIHRAEVARLVAAGVAAPPENQQKAIESIWQNFELRAGLLASLAGNIVPGAGQGAAAAGSGSVAPVQPPAAAPPPAMPAAPPPVAPPAGVPPIFAKAPVTPISEAPPAAPPPVQAENVQGNPMSMFAKPKEEAAIPPPAALPAAPPAAPPVQPPAAPPPAEEQKSSPMSFFKGPPKEDGSV